jgi:cytochrome b subunit of formate dehydrogenase
MDKDEYRAYRETVIRRAKQKEEQEKAVGTRPYDPRKMNVGRMPLGCWIWIAVLVVALLGVTGVIKIFH